MSEKYNKPIDINLSRVSEMDVGSDATLSEEEIQLIAIIISFTQGSGTGLPVGDVTDALISVYDFDEYEASPKVWRAVEIIVSRIEGHRE